jgi:predicted acetyltransferase
VDVTIRPAREEDWPALARHDARAFGVEYSEQDLADARLVVDLDRFLVADDGGRIVGVTGDFDLEMTVPGGGSVASPGVTWVSVATTHRRRGLLTALLAEQHRRFLVEEQPLSILTASESGIYGRYGYGPASELRRVEVDRRFASVRSDLPESGAVRLVDAGEALEVLPPLHDRWRRLTPGAIRRSEVWWQMLLLDREHLRGGGTGLVHVAHPDGYASYRVSTAWKDGFPANEVEVVDLFPTTVGAAADLWRYLLSLDLVGPIRCWDAPPGDPLPFLLDEPRQARTLQVNDGVWVRLLDVGAALAARTYGVEGSLVLEVHDAFLDRGGRFLVDAGPDGASCGPTNREPDLTLGVAALGSAYLGVHRPSTLAGAGLVEARVPSALRLADALFAAERPAHYGTRF